ncbi:uncharacterized protein N7496_003311 [Penicillium cataractarum]|uniref:DUF202 domain-containing protein n=1 Tax=Penicillium cataractarum TaxID=2100454 RepID=A0A9W9SLR2_9EURO|nr:uncharacterized protein N7496_003311 [Penicillium cataractarum]KAJ5380883.1 hypothetical protein N7496_003311 [Penicillium cataractarum]
MTSLLRRLLPTRIPNTSSQQRDHHANERTFLSWTRAGLGFAAMALALDRLDKIDQMLSSKLNLGALLSPQTHSQVELQEIEHSANKNTAPKHTPGTAGNIHDSKAPSSAVMLSNTFSASRLCQLLGLWSLGYGFFRYWSMRRYLLQGQFVPAFWGPVFMTAGSFGAFMMLGVQMDRRHAHRE